MERVAEMRDEQVKVDQKHGGKGQRIFLSHLLDLLDLHFD